MRQSRTSQGRAPPPPLDSALLEALAIRYVGRFATTRAKLREYLNRKVRERGWEGASAPSIDGLVERMSERGYVDDRAFAGAKAASLSRRGYGSRRIGGALRAAGVGEDDGAEAIDGARAAGLAAALSLARRRRIGPFASQTGDPRARERAVAVLVRGGHDPALARKVVDGDVGELMAEAGQEDA